MKILSLITVTFTLTAGLIWPWTRAQAEIETQNLENWQLISPTSGVFSVEMPGIPEQKIETTEILGQPRDWQLFQLQNDNNLYLLGYLELSETDLNSDSSEDVFNSIQQAILEPINLGDLNLTGNPISVNGYPGREYFVIQDGRIAGLRIFLIENRLYGLLVRSEDINQISQYFNSFQVEPVWTDFSPPTGEFTIQFADNPQEQTDKLLVADTELIWTAFSAKDFTLTEDDEVNQIENIYALAYTDLPPDWQAKDTTEVLRIVSTALLEQLNLESLQDSTREVVINNNPGLEFIGVQDGKIFGVRIYQVNNRLYALFTASNEFTKIDKFFTSFQLL